MRRRFMWLCVGKGYNKAAAAVILHFVTFTKEALGLWPTSSRAGIMLLVSHAAIMVAVIIPVNFAPTAIVIILMSDDFLRMLLIPMLHHAFWYCYCLRRVLKTRGVIQQKEQPLFASLRLFLPLSPFLFLSPASDVRLIELGAQPLAVRSELMESTWLTDKPAENKLSESHGPFINHPAMCGTALTPPNAISGGCFIFSMLKLRFKFLFINVYFLFSVT